MDVVLQDLKAFYATATGEESPAVIPLKVQYADFADWQRRSLSPETSKQQIAYWKDRLSGSIPTLRLGGANPKKTASYEAKVEHLVLAPEMVAKLRQFNRSQGTTLFMTLLGAYELLLAHCTKQNEILVGAPKNNRSTPELEKLAGFFVNTLVLRTKLDPASSFQQLVAQIRGDAVKAFSNSDVPFQKVVQEMRSAGQTSLFQAWFGAIDTLQPFQMGQVVAKPNFISPGTAQFDLAVFISEQSDTVTCLFEYKTDLFSSEVIKGLIPNSEIEKRVALWKGYLG